MKWCRAAGHQGKSMATCHSKQYLKILKIHHNIDIWMTIKFRSQINLKILTEKFTQKWQRVWLSKGRTSILNFNHGGFHSKLHKNGKWDKWHANETELVSLESLKCIIRLSKTHWFQLKSISCSNGIIRRSAQINNKHGKTWCMKIVLLNHINDAWKLWHYNMT